MKKIYRVIFFLFNRVFFVVYRTPLANYCTAGNIYRTFGFIVGLLLICISVQGQIKTPVRWRYYINDSVEVVFSAKIAHGWRIYDMRMPSGSPPPTVFVFSKCQGVELLGEVETQCETETKYDKLFGTYISWYKGNPIFVQKLRVVDWDSFALEGYIDYMACSDEDCVLLQEEFSFSKEDWKKSVLPVETNLTKEGKVLTAEDILEKKVEVVDSIDVYTKKNDIVDYWQPVIEELNDYALKNVSNESSWATIFLLCFGGGFLALLTPCVWSVIPMTVGVFLRRSKSDKRKAVLDAVIFGLSIIVIYFSFGLLITLFWGANALNNLSTGAGFNLLLFALLIVFSMSFFGAFELTLSAKWVNKINKKVETTTGRISIFFMAFTLVLVSFSCTGPIIGGLLIQTVHMGSISCAFVGMFGFGLALAVPFAFFAVFPSLLSNLPKSGEWLNSVKIVLGFLELALALKFLSVADLAYGWNLLDREVFLALWIVLFFLLSFYLLGKIRFPYDSSFEHISAVRLFFAIIPFAFAVYMLPGLWGAPLKSISAFLPPLYTQDFNLYDGEIHPKFYDYDEGMEFARRNKKPVLLGFTGFGCVNCREMEAFVWSDPKVKNIIDNNYILISLYVDDKTCLSEIVEIEEYGKVVRLRTIGDRWSYLQRYKFGANAQPYHVLLNNDGFPIAPYYSYNKNTEAYIDFLKSGLERYK